MRLKCTVVSLLTTLLFSVVLSSGQTAELSQPLGWSREVPEGGVRDCNLVLAGTTDAPEGTKVHCSVSNAAYNQKAKVKLFYRKQIVEVNDVGGYSAIFNMAEAPEKEMVDIAARIFSEEGEIATQVIRCIRWMPIRRQCEFPRRYKLTNKVEVFKATIHFNVIGNPEAHVVLFNGTKKAIDACTVDIFCYNNYDEPVNAYARGSNRFRGICQKVIESREYAHVVWTLYGHENTTKIKARVLRWHSVKD